MTRIDLARASDLGSGVPAGTSFPVSPSTDDLFYRTDRDLLYFYDGTRWLTVTLYAQNVGHAISATINITIGITGVWSGDYDVWLEDLRWSSHVVTNNESNFWTLSLFKRDAGSATVVVNPTTAADAQNVYVTHTTAIDALLGTANDVLTASVAATGAPGALTLGAMLTYRLVG